MAAHLALAQRLGAETLVVRGERASEEILAVARERNVTQIVVGKPARRALALAAAARRSIAELVRGSEPIDVLVTSGEQGGEERPAPRARAPLRTAPQRTTAGPRWPWSSARVVCWAGRARCSRLADQAMIYLLGVLIVASRLPRRPSLLAAVLERRGLRLLLRAAVLHASPSPTCATS